jgi:tellurium resistance protein TerD
VEALVGVSLSKGGNVSLTKAAPGLTAVAVGLGWDVRTATATGTDFDASALLTNAEVATDGNFVFYNNLKSPGGSVEHTGDNLTGEGDGGDGSLLVDLSKVPAHCHEIVFPVSIHEADNRGQTFGQVSNAFIRVANQADGQELARYDLSGDASTETAMIFGELYRYGASGSSGPWAGVRVATFPPRPSIQSVQLRVLRFTLGVAHGERGALFGLAGKHPAEGLPAWNRPVNP